MTVHNYKIYKIISYFKVEKKERTIMSLFYNMRVIFEHYYYFIEGLTIILIKIRTSSLKFEKKIIVFKLFINLKVSYFLGLGCFG